MDEPRPQPEPKTRLVEEMARREGKQRPGKRRPGFDRAVESEVSPSDTAERRPGQYPTK
jgi:hypothetical protein